MYNYTKCNQLCIYNNPYYCEGTINKIFMGHKLEIQLSAIKNSTESSQLNWVRENIYNRGVYECFFIQNDVELFELTNYL